MIKILNSSYQRLGIVRKVISATRLEELNGENTMDFEAVVEPDLASWLTIDSIFEVYGQLFRVGNIEHSMQDNQLIVKVECDHISYRLNDKAYDMEPESEDNPSGFPTLINVSSGSVMTRILNGTGFNGSTIAKTIDFEIGGTTTRRQMLLDLVERVAGEVIWNNFNIQIVAHRGSTVDKVAIVGKNILSLTRNVDLRTRPEEDSGKQFLVNYDCEVYEDLEAGEVYSLGDDVRIIDHDLGLDTVQRVISISSNPNDDSEPRKITLGDITHRKFEEILDDTFQQSGSGSGGDDSPGEQGPPGPEGPPGPPGADADPTAAMRSKIQNDDGSRFMQANPDNITIQDGSLTNRYTLDLNNGEEGMVLSASIDPDTMEQKINFQRRKDLSLNRYNISVVTSLPDPSVADMNTLYLLVY